MKGTIPKNGSPLRHTPGEKTEKMFPLRRTPGAKNCKIDTFRTIIQRNRSITLGNETLGFN